MKTLNFNIPVLDLEGNPVSNFELHKTIANALASATSAEPAKLMVLAMDIYKTGQVEVDNTDIAVLKSVITNSINLTNLVKFTALNVIG